MAPAAVPGTSNHGWAIAKDFASETDGDAQPEAITAGAVKWLNENAPRFGWSFELQSEPWHLRHVTGDDVTPAVLAYEQGDDMTPAQANQLIDSLVILTGMANGVDEVTVHDADGRLSLKPFYARIAKEAAAQSAGAHDHDVELTLSAQTLKGTTGPAKPTDG
jgi:hypothetical protein